MENISKDIVTRDNKSRFTLRLFKDEGVGLLTTESDENYLILDSADFWYDLIQSKYPAKTKCKCKNEWFRVRVDYIPRKGTDDIKSVAIITTCTNCFNEKKQFSADIRYSPTDHLIENPITFCDQPKIKYDLRDINCYWTNADLKKFITYLAINQQADIFCWYWQRSDNKRHFGQVTLEKAYEIISVNHRYLDFYFSKNAPILKTKLDDNGVYLEEEQWRRQELIQLSSPFVMLFGEGRKGLLFTIKFSNQYVIGGEVFDKSIGFKKMADDILLWFKDNYIEIRGKNCFDNSEECARIFGDRYTKKPFADK